jgi:hypothetical protein
MPILNDYLTEAELAVELNKTRRALAIWRGQRRGPAWAKIGATVVYPRDEVLAWVRAQVRQPVRERRRVADAPRQAAT